MATIKKQFSLIRFLCCLFLILLAHDLRAGIDLKDFERKTAALFKQLNNYSEHREKIDSMIEAGFMAVLKDPQSMAYSFDSLRHYVTIAISPDKKLCFVSWNTTLGVTMENRTMLAQYIGIDGKVHVCNAKILQGELKNDQAIYFYEIVTLQSNEYLVFGHGKYGTQDMGYSVYNFKIDGNNLIDTNRIFCADSSDLESTIENEYTLITPLPTSIEPVYDAIKKSICYSVQFNRDNIEASVENFIGGENICLIYDGKVFRRKK